MEHSGTNLNFLTKNFYMRFHTVTERRQKLQEKRLMPIDREGLRDRQTSRN